MCLYYILLLCTLQDPPPVSNPTASHSETPADLSEFDIIISWDVSKEIIATRILRMTILDICQSDVQCLSTTIF